MDHPCRRPSPRDDRGSRSQGEAWIGRTMGSYLGAGGRRLTPVGRPFGEWLDDQEDVSIKASTLAPTSTTSGCASPNGA